MMTADEIPTLLYLYPNVNTAYCAGVMSVRRSFDPYLPVFYTQGQVLLPENLPVGAVVAIVVPAGEDRSVTKDDYYNVQMMGELARRMGYRVANLVDENMRMRDGEDAMAQAYREQLPVLIVRCFFPLIRFLCRGIMKIVRGVIANGR